VCVHREISHESTGGRILKIGPHLTKLLSNRKWLTFLRQCISWLVHDRDGVTVTPEECCDPGHQAASLRPEHVRRATTSP